MIDNTLQRAIIAHIIGVFGVANPHKFSLTEDLLDKRFMLDKSIAFENEDGEKYSGKLWFGTAKIENSFVNVMIADITEDITEFAVLIQMDTFNPYALRLSVDEDDTGEICLNVGDNNWVDIGIGAQAKFLSGIEGLNDVFLEWKRPTEYEGMYKSLVGFLNRE